MEKIAKNIFVRPPIEGDPGYDKWRKFAGHKVAGKSLLFWAKKQGSTKTIENSFRDGIIRATREGDEQGVKLLQSILHDHRQQMSPLRDKITPAKFAAPGTAPDDPTYGIVKRMVDAPGATAEGASRASRRILGAPNEFMEKLFMKQLRENRQYRVGIDIPEKTHDARINVPGKPQNYKPYRNYLLSGQMPPAPSRKPTAIKANLLGAMTPKKPDTSLYGTPGDERIADTISREQRFGGIRGPATPGGPNFSGLPANVDRYGKTLDAPLQDLPDSGRLIENFLDPAEDAIEPQIKNILTGADVGRPAASTLGRRPPITTAKRTRMLLDILRRLPK